MARKRLARKSIIRCDACGRAISSRGIIIDKMFDGFAYHFDSDDCLLIFKKLRAIYGKKFFRKLSR